MRRKKRASKIHFIANPPKQEYRPDWRVVTLHSLMLILNFVDGTEIERARNAMLDFMKRHKRYQNKIRDIFVENFVYLKHHSIRKRSKKELLGAKKEINKLAVQVWK